MAGEILRYMGLISFPLTVGLGALSGPLITQLYGDRYAGAVSILWVAGLFGSARALLLPVEQYTVAVDRQDLLMWGTLAASTLNLALAFALIPGGGALGAAWCNGISQVAAVLICWTLLRRHYPVPVAWGALSRMLVAALIMGGIVAGFSHALPAWMALAVGPIVGGVSFVILLRVFHCLEPADRPRLMLLARRLPGRVRSLGVYGITFVTPAGKN